MAGNTSSSSALKTVSSFMQARLILLGLAGLVVACGGAERKDEGIKSCFGCNWRQSAGLKCSIGCCPELISS